MKKKLISILATGIFVLGLAGGAGASTSYYFNFEGPSFLPDQIFDTLTKSTNEVTVDITAWQIDGDNDSIVSTSQLTGGAGVFSASSGIGVQSASSGFIDKYINGSSASGYDEGLLFSFNAPVNFEYINLGSFGTGDDANLYVDGTSFFFDETGNVSGNSDYFDLTQMNGGSPLIGTEFLIWADGSSDKFQIDGIMVSAVPLPGAMWLLGSGLAGLVALRRKKKA